MVLHKKDSLNSLANILGVISPKIKTIIVKPTVVIIGPKDSPHRALHIIVERVVAKILTILFPIKTQERTRSYFSVYFKTSRAVLFLLAKFFNLTLFALVNAVSIAEKNPDKKIRITNVIVRGISVGFDVKIKLDNILGSSIRKKPPAFHISNNLPNVI